VEPTADCLDGVVAAPTRVEPPQEHCAGHDELDASGDDARASHLEEVGLPSCAREPVEQDGSVVDARHKGLGDEFECDVVGYEVSRGEVGGYSPAGRGVTLDLVAQQRTQRDVRGTVLRRK
jgi:hypothetical protein